MASTYQMAVLPLAFGVTTLVRIAQGSATVAMITAVGIFSGMASPAQLGFHPVYLALAIGCGSKPYPWMNDSGFWVVCKMSAMTEGEVLRSYSVMLALMGLVGLIVVMIFSKLMPMI
jgi:GntP family gluconate:H+ symporter